MGIRGITMLLIKSALAAIRETNLSEYKGKTFVIDTSIFLYKALYNSGNHIDFIRKMVIRLLTNGIIPVFILDGKPPDAKDGVLQARLEQKAEQDAKKISLEKQISDASAALVADAAASAAASAMSTDIDAQNKINVLTQELEKTNKNAIRVTRTHIRELKKLLDYMGIPCIQANGEAEALCARLCKEGIADGVISDDTDTIANGAALWIRGCHPDKNIVTEYNLEIILRELKLTYPQFVDMCILCGCDYTDKIGGIGPINALRLVLKYKTIEGIILNMILEGLRITHAQFVSLCSLCGLDYTDEMGGLNAMLLVKQHFNKVIESFENEHKKKFTDEVTKEIAKLVAKIKLADGAFSEDIIAKISEIVVPFGGTYIKTTIEAIISDAKVNANANATFTSETVEIIAESETREAIFASLGGKINVRIIQAIIDVIHSDGNYGKYNIPDSFDFNKARKLFFECGSGNNIAEIKQNQHNILKVKAPKCDELKKMMLTFCPKLRMSSIDKMVSILQTHSQLYKDDVIPCGGAAGGAAGGGGDVMAICDEVDEMSTVFVDPAIISVKLAKPAFVDPAIVSFKVRKRVTTSDGSGSSSD